MNPFKLLCVAAQQVQVAQSLNNSRNLEHPWHPVWNYQLLELVDDLGPHISVTPWHVLWYAPGNGGASGESGPRCPEPQKIAMTPDTDDARAPVPKPWNDVEDSPDEDELSQATTTSARTVAQPNARWRTPAFALLHGICRGLDTTRPRIVRVACTLLLLEIKPFVSRGIPAERTMIQAAHLFMGDQRAKATAVGPYWSMTTITRCETIDNGAFRQALDSRSPKQLQPRYYAKTSGLVLSALILKSPTPDSSNCAMPWLAWCPKLHTHSVSGRNRSLPMA